MRTKEINHWKIPVGVISNEELAEFFEVTYKTFINNKMKYVNLLEPWAEYRVFPGGVEIYDIKY